MEKDTTNPLVARLDAACESLGITREALSLRAGLDRGYLQKLNDRGPHASVRTATLIRLADAADIPRGELLGMAPGKSVAPPSLPSQRLPGAQVPILGVAAGAIAGAFAISNQAIGWVDRPPGLQHVPDAYAVYVTNDSMSPAHNPGDLRFVNPHKPPRAGDTVIVQISSNGSEFEAYIKTLARQSGEWLVCQQLNPAAEVKYSLNTVRRLHKVLTMNELFNA